QNFRGPLTLILNPIEESLKGKMLEPQQLAAVHRNVQKLSELLENSLLMRRLELEDRKLAFKEIDLVTLIRGTMSGFSAMAREKDVRMEFASKAEAQPVWTDEAILEQILSNLFSRVLKSSEPHRNISVQLRSTQDLAIIRIEIDGIAATDSDWAALLNSVRANSALETDAVLLLCRELLGVINGHLEIELVHRTESKSAEGIRFTVSLPETRSELPPAEVSETSGTDAEAGIDEKDLPLILLVESDHDFRKFIREAFTEDHRCIEAEAFDVAVQVARENVPDLIIADFDATQNDPILFCEQLKNDQLTSHIPLIVLGGEISDSIQLRALQVGVDDCLAKPFRLALLKARVANLLEMRRKLHRHFEELKSVQPRELAANQIDAEFLRRVVVIVEKNLADYEFDVETLARQMAVSRRQLFRKFKAIAGCTPNVFIRDLRLKHAAQLLQESGLTVSEIIYAVGFSDPKYFRTVFRERFGVLPGEFGKGAKSPAPGSGI
ncbi:MAG TPA: helix-turn-helix domain-containing protein, partial [Verrucomicrobiae bacterium]